MSQLTVVIGDSQTPFQHELLHELACELIAKLKPSKLIHLGDLLDLPSMRRGEKNPYEPEHTIRECTDSAKKVLGDFGRAAGKQCYEKVLLEGNHEARLGLRLVNAPNVGELVDFVSIPGMIGLAELGYTWVGEYPNGQYNITSKLAAVHGWLVKGDAGATALAHIKATRFSLIHGHTHRLGITHLTQHNIDGTSTVLTGIENGTMCDPSKLRYARVPNWQLGFTLIHEYENGDFHPEQVLFDGTGLIY